MLPAALVALLALALVILGLRGRRVGDHPACRACGFDLRGIYPGGAACPECGAKLTSSSVRAGTRRRRPVLAAWGVLLLVLALASGALLGYARATRYDLNRIKPDWWLLTEARASSDPAALDELIRRLNDTGISGVAAAFLVDRALREQADPDGDWFGRWDDLFGAAHAKGQVSEGQLKEYARNAVVREFEHRGAVRRDAPWRLGNLVTAVRVTPGAVLSEACRPQKVYVGEQLVWTSPFSGKASLMPLRPNAAMTWRQLDYDMPGIDLAPGTYPVRVVARRRAEFASAAGPVPLVDDTVEFESTIEVLPADAQTVEFVTDESLRARVRAAVSVRPLRLFIDDRLRFTWGAIDVTNPPMGLAFDIYWRAGDREWLVGRMGAATTTNASQDMGGREFPLDGLEAGPVDIILRPSATAAESASAIDIRRAWGEEVVFPDMPVEVIDRRSATPADGPP